MVKISVISPSIRPKGLEITQQCLKEQTFSDFEWITEIGLGNKHDFNQAMNRMIQRSKGELIVILQDYIKVDTDFLQRCWQSFETNKDTLFTCAVGKSKELDFSGDIKWDWRKIPEARMNCDCWEIDVGFCGKHILEAVGGFDERLDEYWSMDNVSVGRRAELLGFKFKHLPEITCIAYDHDAFIEHPFRKDYKPSMVNLIMEEYKDNPKLPYLTLNR